MRKVKAPLLIIVLFFAISLINGCSPSINWGSISYNHNLVVTYGLFQLEMRITGSVPFSNSSMGLVDTDHMYQGTGTCTVSISGVADECVISGSGTNSVTFSGNEYCNKILFNFNEQWYQTGSFTFTCPDGTQTITLPSETITHKLTFPTEDGHTIERPSSGMGVSGTYSWTLHIDELI